MCRRASRRSTALDALQNPAMHESIFTAAFGLRDVWSWRLLVLRQDFARVHRVLDLLGVRYYLDKPGRGHELPGLRLLGTSDLDVLESETAWPRAFFTDAVLAVSRIAGNGAPGAGRRRPAIRGDARACAVSASRFPSRLTLPSARLSPRTTIGSRRTPRLLKSMRRAPAWPFSAKRGCAETSRRYVDGHPAEVLRVNHAFRGVLIAQSGPSRCRSFGYWPAVLEPRNAFVGGGRFDRVVCHRLVLPPARARRRRSRRHSSATASQRLSVRA